MISLFASWDLYICEALSECCTAFRAFTAPSSKQREAIRLGRLTCHAFTWVLLCVPSGPLTSEDRTAPTQEGEQNWADKIKEGRLEKRGKQQGSIEWKLMAHLIPSAFLLFKGLWREEKTLKWCLLVEKVQKMKRRPNEGWKGEEGRRL